MEPEMPVTEAESEMDRHRSLCSCGIRSLVIGSVLAL